MKGEQSVWVKRCEKIVGQIMKITFGLLIVVTLCGATLRVQAQKKDIIGYYPSWKWKLGNNVLSPSRIPYEKLTVIAYAFFYPRPNGDIVGRDTVGDAVILRGEWDSGKKGSKTGVGLTELAHRHGVKVVLSIGGWGDSDNFPEVASYETTRIRFAHSCVEQIRTYGFDGIDIDWEYPGYADHKGTPGDKKNFTRLLRVVRDSLFEYGNHVGKSYTLTAALPGFESTLANYEIDSVASLLDRLNIMTYDFVGPWDSLSGHNAPLYASRSDDSLRNVDAAFKLYTQIHSVPAEKVNLGVPFYGHAFAQCTSLYAHYAGGDTVHFSTQGAFYSNIAPLVGGSRRIWDDRAKVPYLVFDSWKTLVSYDDEESVGYKARYVLEKKAAGLIVWEITGDMMPDGRTPLLDVIQSTFKLRSSK